MAANMIQFRVFYRTARDGQTWYEIFTDGTYHREITMLGSFPTLVEVGVWLRERHGNLGRIVKAELSDNGRRYREGRYYETAPVDYISLDDLEVVAWAIG